MGKKPHEMALSKDGKQIFATLYGVDYYNEDAEGGRAIDIIDVNSREKVGQIELGKFRRPHGIAVGKQTGQLYVTCDRPAALLVIDPAGRTVTAAIELANPKGLPHMVQVSPDEKRAFVANAGAESVSVIDLEARKELKQIPIGGVPMGMALTTDGSTLFATNRPADGVAVIDAKEGVLKRIIEITGNPARAHLTPDGKWLLVSLIASGEVAVVDVKKQELVRRIPAGKRLEGLAVDPAGEGAYVSAQEDNKVVKFSLGEGKRLLDIQTDTRPDPLILLP